MSPQAVGRAGCDYLTRQVAVAMTTEKYTGLASYWLPQRGESPGLWVGFACIDRRDLADLVVTW